MTDKRLRALIQDNDVVIVRKSKKSYVGKAIYYVVGAVLSLVFLFPILYMIAASTKSEGTITNHAGTIMMFIPDFSNITHIFDNYKVLFGDYGFGRYALNSLAYAAIVIVLNILINGLAAYAICKLRFPGKRFFNFIIMFLIIVPVETSIIPLYTICKTMLNMKTATSSLLAIILPPSISIFNIFLFIQFFSSIPKAFEEAARMDGANSLQIFFKVILPLSKPIIATVAVFCFIGVWNDYLWPTMVLTKKSQYPVQAALTTIRSIKNIQTGEIMASLVATSIPIFIVYIAAQKYIVKGFGAGGLKI